MTPSTMSRQNKINNYLAVCGTMWYNTDVIEMSHSQMSARPLITNTLLVLSIVAEGGYMKKELKDEWVRFRVTAKLKKKILKRTKKLTVSGTLSEYMTWLVEHDG